MKTALRKAISIVVFLCSYSALVLLPIRYCSGYCYASSCFSYYYKLNHVRLMKGFPWIMGVLRTALDTSFSICCYLDHALTPFYEIMATFFLGCYLVNNKTVRRFIRTNWKRISDGVSAILHLSAILIVLALLLAVSFGFYSILEEEYLWDDSYSILIMSLTFALWFRSACRLRRNKRNRTLKMKKQKVNYSIRKDQIRQIS